ncbi:hypothetical protein [uncultured Cellulomonas sp.]|uniref:hypothetical protein n=1 Tax=uncultured Cellulomonas sp. TaxID=189682 RepID=UPI0028E97932|nr:hypothetical protein [uncultured Cellulomonas sp.]
MAVSDLGARRPASDVADVARHPVQQLVTGLATVPRLPGSGGFGPPSARWSDAPTDPKAATSRVDQWRGLVVSAAGMTHAITSHAAQLSEEERWGVVRTVASLAEVLAVTRLDLFRELELDGDASIAPRRALAALALAAREVSRLAGDEPAPATSAIRLAPGRGHRPVTVSDVRHLAPAATNLSLLLVRREPATGDLLAVTRVLAQTSCAAAAALRAADRGLASSPAGPATLTAVVLEQHADALARAVVAHRATLGSLTPSSAVVVSQAREIDAWVRRVLVPMSRHPADARAAAPALMSYARAATLATAGLVRAVETSVRTHGVAIRDRSEQPLYLWRPANHADLEPFLLPLEEASIRLRSGLANASAVTGPDRAAGPVATDATTSLRSALERRQIALRPSRPGWPALTLGFDQVPRVAAASWIA